MEERFLNKVEVKTIEECWEWLEQFDKIIVNDNLQVAQRNAAEFIREFLLR